MDRKELRAMADKWQSTVVARSMVKKFSGGAICGKTVANADSEGKGPEGRFRIGRSIVYPVAALVVWLENRTSVLDIPVKQDNDVQVKGGGHG